MLVPPHHGGLPFIGGGIIAALILLFVSEFLAFIALVFTIFCLYFFRNPDRVTPQKPSLVLAGGDGEISAIVSDVSLPSEMAGGDDTRYTRISTFLSVFDVHVQRIPVSGRVIRKVYTPGKFINADLDKASEDNERCSLLIETPTGQRVCIVQIAGLVARRIVNDIRENDVVTAGQRLGIIRFGSRVDIYVPEGTAPLACIGQLAIGGETVLADLEGVEPARYGSVVS